MIHDKLPYDVKYFIQNLRNILQSSAHAGLQEKDKHRQLSLLSRMLQYAASSQMTIPKDEFLLLIFQ